MPPSTHSRSTTSRACTALLSASLGWLLVLALAHALQPSSTPSERARVHIKAELRVGEERPASAADVAKAQASLRAPGLRVRSAPQALAAPAGVSIFALPARLHWLGQRQAWTTKPVDRGLRRAVVCSWPLPRSSCHDSDNDSDDDARS